MTSDRPAAAHGSVGSIVALPTPAPTAAVFETAVASYRRGALDQATAQCSATLRMDPGHFQAMHMLALIAARNRRHAEALAWFDRAIETKPDFHDAINNRGIALRELKRPEEAIASFDHALALKPDFADASNNRGNALLDLDRFEEALRGFDRALELRPDHADALNNRGSALYRLQRFAEALASFDRALALRPSFPSALMNRGNVLRELGRLEEALASVDRALALEPRNADAHHGRGETLFALRRIEEALQSQSSALALRPDYREALIGTGNALRELGRPGDALRNFDKALVLATGDGNIQINRANALNDLGRGAEACAVLDAVIAGDPLRADAHNNRGNILLDLGRQEDALASYDQAIALDPDNPQMRSNRGNALRALDRIADALASYDQALAMQPDFAEALTNRGLAFTDLMRLDEAAACHSRALGLDPEHGPANWNLALLQLLRGDLRSGWPGYEWRWRVGPLARLRRAFTQKPWLGKEDLHGKTILLRSEQGLGDAIQFCRYVPAVAARGASVILAVPAPLETLMRGLPGAELVTSRWSSLPHCEFQCPLMSLPLAFDTELANIPPMPALTVDPVKVAAWRQRIGDGRRLRVGLVWSGSTVHKNDRNRSLALAQLRVALPDDIDYICLQKEIRADDLPALDGSPSIRQFSAELVDFSDTAALVTSLDLVISVDTSVAHLAAALGKPTWILLPFVPDWRWLLDRDDSPWYPSVRLFRQPALGDWASVLSQMRARLEQL